LSVIVLVNEVKWRGRRWARWAEMKQASGQAMLWAFGCPQEVTGEGARCPWFATDIRHKRKTEIIYMFSTFVSKFASLNIADKKHLQ